MRDRKLPELPAGFGPVLALFVASYAARWLLEQYEQQRQLDDVLDRMAVQVSTMAYMRGDNDSARAAAERIRDKHVRAAHLSMLRGAGA